MPTWLLPCRNWPRALAEIVKAAAEIKGAAVPAGLEGVDALRRPAKKSPKAWWMARNALFSWQRRHPVGGCRPSACPGLELGKLTDASVGFPAKRRWSGGYAAGARP